MPASDPPTDGTLRLTPQRRATERSPAPTGGATQPSEPTASRRRLGAGLVEVPPVPYRDPASAVMSAPTVAEHSRFCARCRTPVGRGDNGRPGRSEGFCRSCGAPFSFTPKLRVGDLVARQYEVVGCLAHGGLGWIYLAKDRNVGDRWVVLKGVMNAGDEDAVAAALAERRFLAEVEHPNIVKIFNFVERDRSGYIVMEYIGGASLKELLASRRRANGGRADPLPVAHAIAYILEILPALAYLHRRGLLFCDFKLDNVVQTEHSLKLIDLGGVARIDDVSGPVYGTLGYRAPEIERAGPSVSSDLFTVARTLAMLCTDFDGYRTIHKFTLPPRDAMPPFAACDALYELLVKATAPDPTDRFQSADEMADQLFGVLREVVARESGRPVPGESALFTEDFRGDSGDPDWQLLPALRVAGDDPAAGYLATLAAADPAELIGLLRAAPDRTVEVDLRLARALIEDGRWAQLDELLRAVAGRDPAGWRASWYRGVAALARGRPEEAREHFATVYRAVPGELGPTLALAVSAEYAGDPSQAAHWYEVVSRTDRGYTTATLGLARCGLACGDRSAAVAAYDRVPESSSSYVEAQVAKIRCLVAAGADFSDLHRAATTLESLRLDEAPRARLTAELLHRALGLIESGTLPADAPDTLAGHQLTERGVRLGLERTYRALASVAGTSRERIRLVDLANRIRPRTWT